jgi:hypothetical protein
MCISSYDAIGMALGTTSVFGGAILEELVNKRRHSPGTQLMASLTFRELALRINTNEIRPDTPYMFVGTAKCGRSICADQR